MRRQCCVVAALLLSACAPPGYVFEPGDFLHPHPSAELCASKNLVLDPDTKECVMPPPPPLPPRHPRPVTPARPSPKPITSTTVPIEPKAEISEDLRSNAKLLKELVSFVNESGHQCHSISSVGADAESRTFTLACDHRRYAYEIENKDAHWIVTPK